MNIEYMLHYVRTFEDMFLGRKGELQLPLRFERGDHIRLQKWWNANRIYISVITGVKTREIRHSYFNPLPYFSFSFTCYTIITQLLKFERESKI